ncbi:MAG: GAF domain-containing protein [Proteobacteria bacterium]|nr:GAF domain-containing protein [Pseudomonadota bacterium]
MQLGYELIKNQFFFRKELIERVGWFIRLRWMVVCVGLTGSVAGSLVWPPFPFQCFLAIFLFITAYNISFYLFYLRLNTSPPKDEKPYVFFTNFQIGFDLLALGLMIHFTGGIHSPFLFFIILHVIIAGILLSPPSSFIYGMIMLTYLGIEIFFQYMALLSPQPVLFQSMLSAHVPEMPQTLFLYLIYAAIVFATAALTTSIKVSLRVKGRELLSVSRYLDASNKKLNALYDMVKAMGMCTDLQELMDSATCHSSGIMGVKACAIKLLDDQKKKLRFVSTYGLSGDYIAKSEIDVEKSVINRRIIEGQVYASGRLQEKDQFQYPEDIQKEGIASMVCLPLRVEKRIFGVFCLYSGVLDAFEEGDIRFFTLISDLTALAIENLRSELTKTWFLQKTAHQLRAPLNAVQSMLRTLRKGYLGAIDPPKTDILIRCEKRIEALDNLISDLLELSIRRAGIDPKKFYPVNVAQMVDRLLPMYRAQADEKDVEIECTIQEPLSAVMGDNALFDDLFGNLISNAVKYTPKGGRIRIAIRTEDSGQMYWEIQDTGIGIPEEERSHLFTEFFRGQNARAITEEGTGLGLVIVREILNQLNGTIHITSTVGKGTCMILRMPSV